MKQFLVFHPFLFAIFPILFLFAYNIDEIPATDLLLPMLIVIIGTLILLLSLRLITKNYNKIAIIASSFLILFFSYGYVRDLIWSYPRLQGRTSVTYFLAYLWAFLLITLAFLIIKSRRNFSISTKFLNIVAVALIAISLINIGIYEIRAFTVTSETTSERPTSLDLENSPNLPDIYYIILDSYARQDTLKEVYNYDNSQFIDYLTNKGFYVAPKSRSNYSHSAISLPSSLNMRYLTQKELSFAWKSSLILDNEVSRFLKSKGYRYIFVSGGLVSKDAAKYADAYVPSRGLFGDTIFTMSDFTISLIERTAFDPIATLFISSNIRKGTLYAFDKLADMPNISGRKFIFGYILPPHPPYVFDRDGNPPEGAGTYIDQLVFINKKVEALVDEILMKSDIPPIIIIQADHGRDAPRHNILNAYYLPGKDNRLLYETISPVNSFRIVFNLYFDTDYELLKDESN